MPDITLVIVNYFSANLARAAITSARKTTVSPLRVVVVDNSVNSAEASLLESAGADEVIVAPDNRGYSGGANLGAAVAMTPIVVVSNPDVVFGDSCLDRLAALLRGDVAVTGPAFHWDDAGKWLLPPAETLDTREKLSQVLASRSKAAARARDSKRTRRRIEFWRRSAPGPVDAVSGALMAIDRTKFDAVGGFDTRFELYFEEIDLARRLRARGWEIHYVPSARCRHIYNQSAALDSESGAKLLRSEDTYLRRWARLARPLGGLVRVATVPDESGFRAILPSDPIDLPAADQEWLVEASPLLNFDSAVGCFARGERVVLPEEIWSSFRSPALYLRVVDPETVEPAQNFVIRR